MKSFRPVVTFAVLALAGIALAEQRPATTQAVKIPPLMFGQAAPEILVTDLAGKSITLESFKGKPVVFQFGSITEPVFRKHAPDAEKLAKDYGDKVAFVVIYQRESHAADGSDPLEINHNDGYGLAAPVTQDERIKLAKMAIERLGIKNQRVVADAFNDTTARRYAARPNATYLLDARGGLAAAYPWMDVKKLKGAVDATLKDKPVPAEFQGPVRMEKIPAAAFEGPEGRLSIALALDTLELNDKQKQALYIPIAHLMADLREFRERRTDKDKQNDDFQNWQAKLREGYEKVRTAAKEHLSAEDAKKVIDALDRTIPPRLLNAERPK